MHLLEQDYLSIPLCSRKSRRNRNRRKSSRVSNMTDTMNPKIWEKFPEDLFEVVLARLPIASIICFRTVCRKWNNLIVSQRFSQLSAQVSQVYPWFYTTFGDNNYEVEAMYDPFMKRWYYPNTFEMKAFPVSSARGFPVSSARGLVCFADNHYYNPNLYVCNPMTQSYRKLPAGSIKRWCCSGMRMNGNTGYMVLKLGYAREYEIYDSVTKCWSHLGKIPECIKWPGFIIFNHVSIDNTLYFKHEEPEGILSYDTSTGVWTQHLIQALFDLTLAEVDGRIMLVGLVTENYDTCLCIWEVQKMTFLLKEVDRVPFSEFNGRLIDLTCLGNKGLLLCCLKSRNRYRMITYNIATREWVKVHEPYGRKLHKQKQLRGIAFQPCLTAMP